MCLGHIKPTPEECPPFFGFDAQRNARSKPISAGMSASIANSGLVAESVLLEGHNFVAKLVFNDGLVARLPRSNVGGANNERRSLPKVAPVMQMNALVKYVAPMRPDTFAFDVPIHKFVYPEMVQKTHLSARVHPAPGLFPGPRFGVNICRPVAQWPVTQLGASIVLEVGLKSTRAWMPYFPHKLVHHGIIHSGMCGETVVLRSLMAQRPDPFAKRHKRFLKV
jgi:hypothetical protein